MRRIILATLIIVSFLTMNAAALVYLDPKADEKEAKKHLASSLVRHTGERVLMYEGREMNLPAISVLALARGPYKEWSNALRKVLSQRFGIVSEGEAVARSARDPASADQMLHQYPDGPLLGEGFVGFQALGVRVEQPEEYRIHTARYNQIEAISGYSELEVRLTDGRKLFGKDSTVIVLRRTDHSREWYRHFQLGIPLPFKHDVAEDLVTSTEIDIVDSVKHEQRDGRVEYFVPYPAVEGTDYWHDFLGKILHTVDSF